MLKTFIRFTEVDYCIESQDECLVESVPETCEEVFETKMIAKASDVISFIVSKAEYDVFISSIHLKAALTSCGIVTQLDIATIEQSTSQYYFTCTLPSDLENGEYEITIYKDYQLQVIAFTPETSEGACDGTFTVEVISAPAIDFEFSIEDENFIRRMETLVRLDSTDRFMLSLWNYNKLRHTIDRKQIHILF